MPIFSSKYQLAEPGIDPISNPIPHQSNGLRLSFTLIAGIGFGLCMLFGLVVRPLLAAKAAPKSTEVIQPTNLVEQTFTPTKTFTLTSTATGTKYPTFPAPSAPPQVINRIITQEVLVPVQITQIIYIQVTVIKIKIRTVIVTPTFTRTPVDTDAPIDTETTQPSQTPSFTPTFTPTIEDTLTNSPMPTEIKTLTDIPTETKIPLKLPTKTATSKAKK